MEHDSDRFDKTAAFVVLTAGAKIGPYTLEKKLGVGGMGEVYLAEDTRLQRRVALKFLSPDVAVNADFRTRFIREARSAARLNHPNIVTVYEVTEHSERVFIAMEFVSGQPLKEIIGGKPVDAGRSLGIILQVCEGLAAAHKIGLVHRDIKPLNIIVDTDRRVRILDFGLAKSSDDEQLTKEGMMMGTVDYMSPEQSRGEEADHRSDIFSTGIMLYEMLTGKVPFHRANIPATLHAIVNEAPTPLSTVGVSAPEGVQQIVDLALAKDREQRYQDIEKFADDLRQVMQGMSGLHSQVFPGSQVFTSATMRPSAPPQPAVRGLAVLYLRNLGGSDDEYLSYGITEDLIIDLSRLEGVRVTPMRTIMKYKDSDAELDEIGSKLNVSMVLDGSIQRSSTALRISAHLVDAGSNDIVWADRWEVPVDELPTVKRSLANAVSQALDVGKTMVKLAQVGQTQADDAEAYDYYLRGKYAFERKSERGDVEIAVGLYRQALKKEPTLIAARAGIAEVLIYLGEFEEARTELEGALADARSRELRADEARVLRLLTTYHIRRSAWQEAWDAGNDALAIAREVRDLTGEAETLGLLISTLQPQARFDEALGLFDRVLEISRQLEDHEKTAEALKNMGVAYSRKGEYARAMDLYEEAGELAKAVNNLSLQAACSSNIGNIHFFQGELEQALDHYAGALDINMRLGDQAGIARQNLNLGLINLQRGEHEEGLKRLTSSADAFKSLGDRSNFAMTLTNISQVRLNLGEYESAQKAASRALEIASELSYPLVQSRAHLLLGLLSQTSGNYEAASEHLHNALSIAEQAEAGRSVAALEATLAGFHYDRREMDSSLKHARRAQARAKEIGEAPTMCLAAAYEGALEAKRGLYNMGIRQLQRQLDKARELGDTVLIVQVESLLGEVMLTKGDVKDQEAANVLLQRALERAQKSKLSMDIARINHYLQDSVS